MNNKLDKFLIDKFKKAVREYYELCKSINAIADQGREDILNLITDLENNGMDREQLRKIDDEIYSEVYGV